MKKRMILLLSVTALAAFLLMGCGNSADDTSNSTNTSSAQTSEDTTNNGVFVCFAPYEDPEIAVAIVIERGGSGSALASTAVEILNAYFADSDIGTALIPEGSLLP